MEPKAEKYLKIIMSRGTATYKNGMLDFTHGEGGNNHIHAFRGDDQIGYIWLDTHCGYGGSKVFAFCGKGKLSVNGLFRSVIQYMFPVKWKNSDSLVEFTAEEFTAFMDAVITELR